MSTRTLSEHESGALLAGYGVPRPRQELASDAAAAVAVARAIGFPVVVKLCELMCGVKKR